MRRLSAICTLLLAGAILAGCGGIPRSFNKSLEPTWANFQIRSGLEYQVAWDNLLEVLVNDFDLEFVDKEDGYLRTQWLYTWSGRYLANYRVRVLVKFAPDRKRVRVKTEAQALAGDGRWIIGVDDRLVATIKTDLMGTLGRTTR